MNDNTKKMLNFFYQISSIPRESGHEEKIADYLIKFANKRNLECYKDEYNNVLIKKYHPNAEDTIILQAHTDMVCVKADNINHNFENDAINIVQTNDIIKAKGTTLGADDGIGMAIILYILDSAELNTVNFECVFTAQEETTFAGAVNFDYTKLNGNKLINFDGCEDDVVVSSCDGDFATKYTKRVDYIINNFPGYKIKISNLKGGNSGTEAENNRLNAITIMAKVLKKLSNFDDVYINSFNGGNSEINIATECECRIATKIDNIEEKINNIILRYKTNEEEPIINICSDNVEKTMDLKNSYMLIDEILDLKKGTITLRDEEIVTFGNIGKISTNENIEIQTVLGSNDYDDLQKYIDINNELSIEKGFEVETIYEDNIWEFNVESELRDRYSEAYCNMFDEFPKIKNSHGLLECTVFAKRIKNVDMISIGAIIEGNHTIDEKIYISSCEKFLTIIIDFFKNY